jgi:tetratricopeptide (TPR) repeat protein
MVGEDKIRLLLEKGDENVATQQYEEALKFYRAAVELVPEPFTDQEVSTEILTAIGDVYFLMGEYDKAQRAFADVMLCPGAPANEYIRLRRGQIAYELGDLKTAKKELACAYMNGGKEVFEDEDSKYFKLIEPILKGLAGSS